MLLITKNTIQTAQRYKISVRATTALIKSLAANFNKANVFKDSALQNYVTRGSRNKVRCMINEWNKQIVQQHDEITPFLHKIW